MISAPDERRDVQVEHVWRVAEDLLQSSARYGTYGAVSISAGGQLELLGDARPAPARPGGSRCVTYHLTHLTDPLVVNSFAPLTSASVRSGFFEKSWTQPPVPQPRR